MAFIEKLASFLGWKKTEGQPTGHPNFAGHSFTGSRMQGGYLLEIRFYGPAKKFAKDAIYTVAKRFHVRGNTQKNPVPHVTLYGSFSTNDPSKVRSTIEKVCEKYSFRGSQNDLVMYKISGFKTFQGASSKVICLDIIPSKKLNDLTTELADELNTFCKGQPWDVRGDKLFHATIAFRDPSLNWKHQQIMNYLSSIRAPSADYPVIRVTVIRPGRKILCEYDLIQNRLLNRDEALNGDIFRRSIAIVKELLYGQNPELAPSSRINFSKRRSKGNVRAQKRRQRTRRRWR